MFKIFLLKPVRFYLKNVYCKGTVIPAHTNVLFISPAYANAFSAPSYRGLFSMLAKFTLDALRIIEPLSIYIK